jgi:hypothetical protein
MKLLLLLFTTSNCNNNPIPDKNKYILGISSLWILTILRNSLILMYPFISFIIISISIISPLFWYKYQLNSLLHKLDKYLVWTIAIINFKYALIKLYISTTIILLSLIVLFYYLSDLFIINKKFKYQLISHLLFRYIFFIWIYLTFYNTLSNLFLITLGYIYHNYYLYISFNKNNYLLNLIKLIFIICLYLKNDYYIKDIN